MFIHKLKMAIVIRADLKLTKGKIASQTAHAAVTCFQRALDSNASIAHKWLRIGQPKIILKVNTEEELKLLKHKASDMNIITSLISDAGRTQVDAGTVTCLGLGPDFDEKIDAVIKELKLL